MSKINYQALREIAKQATQGEWCAFISPGTGTYAVHTPGDKRCEDVIKWTGFDGQKNAENNARYIAAFNPEVVQALLDEREKNQQYIKRRDQENEMMVDAMHAAIALTSVGIDLDDYDECVLRLHEWGALPDYCIALYVDFVHGIVSKNKLLDFGYINGAPVWTLRDELEAAKSKLNEQREYYEGVISDGSKRIAELEACRAALAAENAGLKAICDDRRRLIMNGVQMGYIKVPTAETAPDLETIRIAISPQKPIPATDAFLAEVRAQGVEMIREHPSIKLCSLTHICDELAAQLRKGGNQ